jgi:hypothetical protein
MPVANGGTGYASFTDGELLIGNTTGNTLTRSTLTAGNGVSITNGSGSITIAATGSGGTVTNVNPITVTASGSTFTSTVTNATSTPAIALTIPLASVAGTTAGLLSKADYDIFNAKQNALISGTNYIAPNAAITGATKTKITYDEKGLVTAGADATTADIAPSTNRNYVTDIKAGVLSNTTGTNTGDQTITLMGDVTGTGTGTFTSTIANSAVTYAKMQNVTAGKLLGSTNTSAAAPGEVTIGSGLSLSGGNLTATGTGGTVTNVNPITVTASGSTFTSTVTNATTTPAIALTIPLASVAGTTAGLLSNTDYTTFNNKQVALTAGAGSGISISGGTISATGITTSNLSSTAGILNAQLANSAITLGSTSMSLGSTNTSIAGLTSVSSTGFTGDLTGNASTATALATARSIYGNNFDGTAALSGVISTTFGGTGASSTSQNFVFAGPTSGAGAPSFRQLTSSDVPAGSGNYIANGTTQQTSANFNISGTGVVGTSLSAGSLSLTTALSVANGGTGASTLTGLIKGNGTGAMTAAVAGTDFVAPNSAITGATKTKITFDAKGLVTAGADATTADIAPSTNRNYVTDIKAGVLSNTTGTNTGDQTIILTGDVTGTGTGTFTSTIANSAVTYAKMQNVGANKLVGSTNSTSAAVAGEVSIGTGLSLTNGTLTATGTGGTVTNVSPITLTTTGSTFTSTVANASTTPAITLNIPSASVTGTTAGLLSKAEFDIFNAKVAPNTAITGATKTKITFDAKGLVTAGADATTADIAPSTDRNYITDIKAGVLSNTSGTNTGDQTITLTGDVTGTGTGTFSSTIANSAVTYAKMQNITAGKLLGSISASSAAPGAVTIGSGLSLSDGTLTATGTGGTVTNVSPISVTASGSTFTSTVTNATTTPAIALTIPLASESGTTAGLLSKTDYDIFNAKQSALTLGSGVQTFIATPSSANLANTITDETGTGKLVFATSPTLETPTLGNATATSLSSGTLTLTTALTAANGGTSQSTYAKGDILYASAANTLSKLTIGSEGQVLVTTSTGVPSWGSNGLYSFNGQTASLHALAMSSSTTNTLGWSSASAGTPATATHTLTIPDATGTVRGFISTGSQSIAGDKTFSNDISVNSTFFGRGNPNSGVANNLSIGVGGKNFGTNTTGAYNIAIGATTLTALTNGTNNNAIGFNALKLNTTGGSNNAFGANALTANLTGSNNTAIGEGALSSNNGASASNNTAVGWSSFNSNTTGDQNTAIGSSTNVGANNLNNATAIGFGAIVNASNTIQLGNTSVSSVVTSGTLSATGAILGTLRVTGGSGTAGRVLTSDASGNATWQAASLGITGVGTMTTTSYAAGATVSGNSLILAPADGSFGGVVSTFTQTFAGAKTFNSDLVVNGLTVGRGKNSVESNTAVGIEAVVANTSATLNTGIGMFALRSVTSGGANTAVGANSLVLNRESQYNSALGFQSLYNTTGAENTGFGKATLYWNTNGSRNTAIGMEAGVGRYDSVLTNATAIGAYATVTTSNTIQLGADGSITGTNAVTSVKTSGALTTGTVTYPIAHGSSGQVLSTTGSGTLTWTTPSAGITGVGTMTTTSYAAGATVSGNSLILAPADGTFGGVVSTFTQTFAGAKTFNSDIVVNGFTIGKGKGQTTNPNTVIGISSLNANTSGIYNIAIAPNTLEVNTTGSYNSAIGSLALNKNTIGNGNIAIGYQALNNSTTKDNNTAIGYRSMLSNTEGYENTGIGKDALSANTTGFRNTAIGFEANVGSGTLSNSTAIGASATVSASNTIQLGNASVTSINTSGSLTTGTVTYPRTHGSNGQVLSTTGSGTLTWTTASGVSAVGTISTTSTANGATITAGTLNLAAANASHGGVLTSGTQTIGGQKSFDKAVSNLAAFNAGTSTTIDFSNSNLAYTGANPGNTFTLNNMKDGGTYTLAVQGTTSGTASFTISGYTNVFLGNYASVSGKETVYTFVVMGVSGSGKVYISMVSQQ